MGWACVVHVPELCNALCAGGRVNVAGKTPQEDEEGEEADNPQWHALGHAGPPKAVSDLIPRVRADWFDSRVTLDKLQDRNPNRVGGAWPLGIIDQRICSSRAVHVSCGYAHTAAVTDDGCVWTWGAGQEGQLGQYNWESRRQPTRVHLSHAGPVAPPQESPKKDVSKLEIPDFSSPAPAEGSGLGGKKVSMVDCGQAHTAAVTRDGSLWLWGRGHEGQLGLGHVERLNVPTILSAQALGRSSIAMVACGACHTAVVTDRGGVWTWGLGEDGQLGHEQRVSSRVPVEIGPQRLGGLCALMISCGHSHTGVITEGGGMWMWGAGAKGRLGLGDSERRLSPTQMPREALGGERATMVSCGGAHSAAVTEGGALWLWGWNRYGQCACPESGDLLEPRRASAHAMAGAPAAFVCCGGSHTAVITEVSSAQARPSFVDGCGPYAAAAGPQVELRRAKDFGSVDYDRAGKKRERGVGGEGHTVVWTFGRGSVGQLGHGKAEDEAVPTMVSGGWCLQPGVRMVACGDEHTALVTGDLRLFNWSFECCAGKLRQRRGLMDRRQGDQPAYRGARERRRPQPGHSAG